MEHLTGNNIRKGLELEIPVSDIFKITTNAKGDPRIMNVFLFLEKPYFWKKNSDLFEKLNAEEIITYHDTKEKYSLSTDLDVFVFNRYEIYADVTKNHAPSYIKDMELQFSNKKILDFEDFCVNLMIAQAFTGNFKQPEMGFSYPFVGIGSFTLRDIILLYPMINATNLNLDKFFIYHENVLTTVSKIISATFEDDIQAQKSYLSEANYKSLVRKTRKMKKELELLAERDFLPIVNDFD